ncbi:MAG: hypothetical protein Q4A49_04125 [Neisseria sp.]|nr:hypothetical protein [Neisseria sp.]
MTAARKRLRAFGQPALQTAYAYGILCRLQSSNLRFCINIMNTLPYIFISLLGGAIIPLQSAMAGSFVKAHRQAKSKPRFICIWAAQPHLYCCLWY